MDAAQLPAVVGFVVSLVVQLLKRWAKFEASDAVVKQFTAALLAALGVLIAAQWKVDQTVLMQAVGAAIMALATHKVLLKQPAKKAAKVKEADNA